MSIREGSSIDGINKPASEYLFPIETTCEKSSGCLNRKKKSLIAVSICLMEVDYYLIMEVDQ